MSSKNKPTSISKKETEEESLIEFPCEFPVKVMGPALPEFHQAITKIATSHDEDFDDKQTTQNVSKTGKYVSLTLNIHAKNKPQLDALYKDFTEHELVLWAL
ncbi:MAG: putative lipoic acid-binding regulatory protein [Cocleimonas sp.]|jgi:putative lipoic acid-binding regulatory protein